MAIIESNIEGNIVRLDYLSYVVAVICFLLAAIIFAVTPTYIPDTTIVYTLTVVLAILGLILAGVGYSQKPKETTSQPMRAEPEFIPAEPAPSVPPNKPVPATLEPIPAPTPTPTTTAPPEETRPQEEIKPEKKAVRKRRKKA